MTLFEILRGRGFDISKSTKMMRHQSKNYNTQDIFERGHINSYQSVQSKPLLKCEYLVSFIAQGNSKACFAGIWKVKGLTTLEALNVPVDFPYPKFFSNPGDVFYDIEKVAGFDDLIGRLIIDWGTGTRSWHQWLKDKSVIELLPMGHIAAFPGYLDFILSYNQLCNLFNYPDANRVWHQMLKSVAGIYLISDTLTGQQYVGSAYGKDGILGRWKNYASNGHCGNKELAYLFDQNPDYAQNFQFTILRTLPTTLTSREVIAIEGHYKNKLGSRAHGLNAN